MIRPNQVESWDKIDPNYWKVSYRAHGDCLCLGCGVPLWRHGKPLPELCPSMIQDCEGNWWKL